MKKNATSRKLIATGVACLPACYLLGLLAAAFTAEGGPLAHWWGAKWTGMFCGISALGVLFAAVFCVVFGVGEHYEGEDAT